MRTSLFVSLLFIANSLGGVTPTIVGADSKSVVMAILLLLSVLDTIEVLGKTK